MEINRKLELLTEEQIEEVITMYKDKSIRLSNIISKYNIDVKPSGLLSILPPIKTDEVCAICGAYLYQKLKPRTGYASDSQKDKFCLECGHWVYAKSIWETKKCTCGKLEGRVPGQKLGICYIFQDKQRGGGVL